MLMLATHATVDIKHNLIAQVLSVTVCRAFGV